MLSALLLLLINSTPTFCAGYALLDELHHENREHCFAEGCTVDLGVGAERSPRGHARGSERMRIDLLGVVQTFSASLEIVTVSPWTLPARLSVSMRAVSMA